jgi:uncharacterized protein (TIGR00266 family)
MPLAYEISHAPDYAQVAVHLQPGQSIKAEPDAMAVMDPSLRLKAGFAGGFKRSLGRFIGGESVIVNTFSAADAAGTVVLAAGQPGDLAQVVLDGPPLLLQRGAFLAAAPEVTLSASWQGARGFFGGAGLVLLKASGHGELFFSGFGALVPMDVDGELVVDNHYIVAFEDSLTYRVGALPGLGIGSRVKSFLLGGEGLVCRFSGRGRVWMQTRAVASFLRWVYPYRPVKDRS